MARRWPVFMLVLLFSFAVVEGSQERARVLIIGIDGTRPDALAIAETPNLDRLAGAGAANFDLVTEEYTRSGPAWSTVLTGVGHQKHGVYDNTFSGEQFDTYPHIFRLLARQCANLQTATFTAWAVLNHRLPSSATRMNKCNLLDAEIAGIASDYIGGCNPDATFVHFLQVDEAGHSYGFSPRSQAYVSAIERVDQHVGQLLEAVLSRQTILEENWLILITTDHGGIDTHHGGSSAEETGIFLIVSGPAALPGSLNPMSQLVDIVPTVFDFLEIPIDPAWDLDGVSVGLDPNRPMVDFPCIGSSSQVHASTFLDGLCHWNVPFKECLQAQGLVWDFDP